MKALSTTDEDRAPLYCGGCESLIRLNDREDSEAEPVCKCENVAGYRFGSLDEDKGSSDGDRPLLVCGVCRKVIVVDPDTEVEWGHEMHQCSCDPETVKGYCFLTKEQFITRAREVLG